MAIEFREHHELLMAATKKLDGTLAQLYRSVCAADAVPLDKHGRCKVCGRVFEREPLELEVDRDSQEFKRAQFWARAARQRQEREQECCRTSGSAEFWTGRQSQRPGVSRGGLRADSATRRR